MEHKYEEDNFKTVVNDLEIITETKVQKKVNKSMQIMALEAAILRTQNHDKQKKNKKEWKRNKKVQKKD